MNKWEVATFLGVAAIIILLIYIKIHHNQQETSGLLSLNLYKGAITPESHLIFNFEPLENGIKEYLADRTGTTGIYITNLRDGASLGINEEEEFEPASLNKIPMAILVMRGVENGKFSMNTKFQITPQDTDTKSGSLYERVGDYLTVQELMHAMLAESDNTAFSVFSRQIDLEDWDTLSDYLNYYDISTLRQGPDKGKFLSVTPKSNAHLFTSLYLSTILEPEHSEYILKELTNTSFDVKGMAGIPENVTIAQKFGNYYSGTEEYFHSCGIMYIGEGRFFYCVMTKNQPSKEAEKTISAIVKALYEYVIEVRRQTKENLATI